MHPQHNDFTTIDTAGIKAIIVDIEGTTTDINFVHQTLFPYARERIASFVTEHQQRPDVAEQLALVTAEIGNNELSDCITALENWIDNDRKFGPLKALQGLIWQAGYENQDYHGHIYGDVVVALTDWKQAGIKLYVYSSGSVLAQKLLFAHTSFGDLTPVFSGYFDTAIGHKREAGAYANILQSIKLEGPEVLFLSDITEELDAAEENFINTGHLLR